MVVINDTIKFNSDKPLPYEELFKKFGQIEMSDDEFQVFKVYAKTNKIEYVYSENFNGDVMRVRKVVK